MAIPSSPGSYVGEHQNGYFWNGTSWEEGAAPAQPGLLGSAIAAAGSAGTPIVNPPAVAPAPATTTSAAPPAAATGDNFLGRAYQFFLSRNYPPHAAAALAANAIAESGGNTRAVHDNGTGIGIYGFRDPEPGKGRKTALLAFAKARGEDFPSEATQLEFAAHELDTSEKKAGDALRASKDYTEAQVATIGYLRPHFYNPSNQTIPADRWNAGAALAGVQPVTGPAMAAAGSADTPVVNPAAAPTAGLLTPSTPIDTSAATAAAEQAREQEQAFAGLTRTGMGLLGKAQTAPAQFAPAPMDWQTPEAKPVALPNYTRQAGGDDEFMKMLMQQRLQRRV